MTPEVLLNGERRTLPDGATVADAARVAGAAADARGVAVALDGEVVPRAEWGSTPLPDEGQVEVLSAVQGG